jgi:hypothetical protein
MNDVAFNWKMLCRGHPKARSFANDRSPTSEELRKLVDYPDRMIKCIVLMMSSGRFRLGAWVYLKWVHVVPLTNSNLRKSSDESNVAAKLTTYAEENEQYFTIITPEAYYALKDWMDFRTSYGETITGD